MLNSSEFLSTKRSNVPHQNVKFRLEFLDGIRGLSALYVTAYHLLAWNLSVESFPLPIKAISTLFRFGHSSVSIFIVISGFSLMLGILADPNQKIRGGFWGYIFRRAKRIMPPYYAAMFLSLIFLYVRHQLFPIVTTNDFTSGFRLDTIVSHLMLIHNLNPVWSSSINFTHWSVATEWQIYFCLPLIFLPLYQRFGTFVMVSVGIIIGILPGFFSWGKDIYVACPWYVGLFSIGMLGAIWANQIVKNPSRNYHRLISRLFLAAFVVTLVSFRVGGNGHLLERFSLQFAYILQSGKDDGVGGIVLSLVLYLTWIQVSQKRTIWANWILTFLSGKTAKSLASFSYSLYLTHAIIVSIWSSIVEPNLPIDATSQWCIRAFFVLPMTIGFAYIFSLLFEAPTQRSSQKA